MLLWHTPHVFYMGVATAGYGAVRRWRVQRQQRLLTKESKDWPTHRGRVVAVQAVRDGNEDKKGKWSGLLTYSYILDEVEIGEYREPFNSEGEVDDWVRALRGEVVTVAVDPKDHRRSIWIAEEAEATRKAAEVAWLEAETAELPVWLEIARIATFAIALVGAVTSVVMEVNHLRMIYMSSSAMNVHPKWWLAIGAASCSGIAAYVIRRRFPKSRMEDIGKRFKDPVVNVFLKGLAIVESSAVLSVWWEWGGDGAAMKGETWNALINVFCGGVFAGAAVALWVAGQRLPAQHELAPAKRGRLQI